MMIIHRQEEKELNNIKNWIFVFGRRKTGKSFLVKNFLKWDEYFFIKRDRAVLSEKEGPINYETFLNIIKRELKENKVIVVDEFHRLGNDFFDYVHSLEKIGKLVLISSTLFLSKKLFKENSPLLGLFAEFPVKIINLEDSLKVLKNFKLSKKEFVENSILLREPLTIFYFSANQTARNLFSKIILNSINTIPAFVGEIFLEEEKSLSMVYEGILRAIANGKTNSTEIANYLFSKKLIANNDASIVQQYLTNLADFGIIKKIRVYNRNKFIYRHISPLTRIFYYADEKYNISERDISLEEISRIVEEIIPRIVEDNIREFLAKKFSLSEAIIETKDYEVDACLLKFDRPEIVVEIKWKVKISQQEITKIEENLKKTGVKRKMLFVQDKSKLNVKSDLEIVDIFDFS